MNLHRWVAALLLVGLAACRAATESSEPRATPQSGGTLAITSRTDVDTINNLVSNGSAHGRDIERFLFLQLARERPDFEQGPPTYEPQLAESWSPSGDGLALTFRLRDVRWSDGTALTAEDVRWTWQAQVDSDVAWRLRHRKEHLEEVEVVDERTVRFHFSHSYPGQLEDANVGAILPRHAWGSKPFADWRAAGAWFAETIVSSGPYRLARWEPDQELVLERNEHYYRNERPRIDRIVVRVVPEKTVQMSQLLGGNLDYVRIVPPDQLERLEASGGIEIDAYPGRNFDYLCWNTRHGPLELAAVRRALTLAIDRQAIVDAIYRGYAKVAVTAFLSSTWGFDPALVPLPYDPSEAQRLLAATGFADADKDGLLERNGVALALDLLVQSGNRVHLDAATLIQAQLARIGVGLDIRPVEFQTWVARVKAHEFEVAIGGWAIPSSLDMSFAFHSREIGNYNFGAYSNADLDRLLEAASVAATTAEKRELFVEIQALLHEEQPYTFLWEPRMLNARRERVRDTRPNALTSYFDVDEWWLAGD